MAIQSGVNPNTIQRTYSELERLGIAADSQERGRIILFLEWFKSVMEQKGGEYDE